MCLGSTLKALARTSSLLSQALAVNMLKKPKYLRGTNRASKQKPRILPNGPQGLKLGCSYEDGKTIRRPLNEGISWQAETLKASREDCTL
jgi:hypothetical protein